jgi:hypothetical protein
LASKKQMRDINLSSISQGGRWTRCVQPDYIENRVRDKSEGASLE